ncbi:hypothetical protein [Phycicoccus sp. 3266]|uniref:hypothetical protein n=1 Tax=Phycicoccus sp. 3266 TaxID=2817751 RepID=UPI00285EC519|nr:hypothetical protein [Phycicoccus sp. 3266]MDR6862024.1 deoxyribose-phosphate aldolase [Phycicoccus sp. 3266]
MQPQPSPNSSVSGPHRGRVELTLEDFAGRLEHRLHWADITEEEFRDGCAYAAQHGISAVLCRPEQVELATSALAGSGVRVVTGLAFHDPNAPVRSQGDLATEAARMVELGAHEVSLLAAPGAVAEATTDLLLEQVAAVQAAVWDTGVTVRVALNAQDMSNEQVAGTCGRLAAAGVHAVQGGAIRGGKVGFGRIELMRDALPRPILLHWAQPVKSVETILVCIAHGIDRFIGDTEALMASALRSTRVAPLTVPKAGLDF